MTAVRAKSRLSISSSPMLAVPGWPETASAPKAVPLVSAL